MGGKTCGRTGLLLHKKKERNRKGTGSPRPGRALPGPIPTQTVKRPYGGHGTSALNKRSRPRRKRRNGKGKGGKNIARSMLRGSKGSRVRKTKRKDGAPHPELTKTQGLPQKKKGRKGGQKRDKKKTWWLNVSYTTRQAGARLMGRGVQWVTRFNKNCASTGKTGGGP